MKTFFYIAILSIFLVGCRAHTIDSLSRPDADGNCNVNSAAIVASGAILGAIAGSLIGGDSKSAIIGAGVGTAIGAGAQSYLVQRCMRIAQAIKEMQVVEAKSGIITVTKGYTADNKPIEEKGTAIVAKSHTLFEKNSSELSPQARIDVEKMAEAHMGAISEEKKDQKILITGHTDDDGDHEYNQKLSEKRAATIAEVFVDKGIPAEDLYIKGAGETQPVSPDDKAINRRVEITDLESEDALLAHDETLTQATEAIAEKNRHAERIAKGIGTNVKVLKAGSVLDLGGKKLAELDSKIDYYSSAGGKYKSNTQNVVSNAIGQLFSTASANEGTNENNVPIPSCINDEYVASPKILSFQDRKPIKGKSLTQFYPGLYNTTWFEKPNGHLVTLEEVVVLKSGEPFNNDPQVLYFEKGYEEEGEDAKATSSTRGLADTYKGQQGLLYKVFLPKEAWPFRCVDVVFAPTEGGGAKAVAGNIFYDNGDDVFVKEYIPQAY